MWALYVFIFIFNRGVQLVGLDLLTPQLEVIIDEASQATEPRCLVAFQSLGTSVDVEEECYHFEKT